MPVLTRSLLLVLASVISTASAASATTASAPTDRSDSESLEVRLRAPYGAFLFLDVDPDWPQGDYRVVVQQRRVDRWQTVGRGRTHGSRDTWRPSVGAGDFRVIVSRPGFATATSNVARILE